MFQEALGVDFEEKGQEKREERVYPFVPHSFLFLLFSYLSSHFSTSISIEFVNDATLSQ
jgi:hypothetical protein